MRKKILIVIPGTPGRLLVNGWSVILQALINTLPSNSHITLLAICPPGSSLECSLSAPLNRSLTKVYTRYSFFELFRRVTKSFLSAHPLQSSLYGPNPKDSRFQSTYQDSDIVVFITSRTLRPDLLDLTKEHTEKKHLCLLIDLLGLAFQHHSISTKSPLRRILSRRESLCLNQLECKTIASMPCGLVNPSDADTLPIKESRTNLFKLPMNVPLCPSTHLLEKQQHEQYRNNNVIYILGNQEYSPNWQSTLKLLHFLSTLKPLTCEMLEANNIEFILAGHLKNERFQWLANFASRNLSHLKFSISQSPHSLDFIRYDGLATMSAVDTTYGAQSKNILSISSLLPIISFSTSSRSDQIPSWKLHFTDEPTFADCLSRLLNYKGLTYLKQDMLRQAMLMDSEYKDFVHNLSSGSL